MPKALLKRLAVAVLSSAALIAVFQNCSAPTSPTSSNSVSAASTSTPIVIAPAAVTVAPLGTQVFSITGGSGTYTVTAHDDCGSVVSATKTYTAPGYNTVCTLIVNDGINSAYATVSVTGASSVVPLSASFTPVISGGTETATIVATGGTGSYTYSKISGAGTLTGNVYTSTSSGETANIQVGDGVNVVTVAIVVAQMTPSTQTVYRLVSSNTGDHMLSLLNNEGAVYNYAPDGTTFLMYTAGGGNRVALRRCLSSTPTRYGSVVTHLASTSADCEGYGIEGVMGYVEATATSAAPNALYRCASGKEWLITKNAAECTAASGYGMEKTLGYVP